MSFRSQVINLFKTLRNEFNSIKTLIQLKIYPYNLSSFKKLLYYGKDYPAGYDYFRVRLKKSFQKIQTLTNEKDIQNLISRGQFVIKEIEALYSLKKYRTLKKNYYDTIKDKAISVKLKELNGKTTNS